MKTLFLTKHQHSANTYTFDFTKPEHYRYEAGQFIELRIRNQNENYKRWFTLSSSPTEDNLAITTKIQPNSPFKQILKNLAPGSEVDISDAMGDFVLPKNRSIPLLFVAGGIGITPVRSMLRWLNDLQDKRITQVLYVTKDTLFTSELVSYGTPIEILNSRTDLSTPLIQTTTQTMGSECQVYLSGPEYMVEQLVDDLKEMVFHLTN